MEFNTNLFEKYDSHAVKYTPETKSNFSKASKTRTQKKKGPLIKHEK